MILHSIIILALYLAASSHQQEFNNTSSDESKIDEITSPSNNDAPTSTAIFQETTTSPTEPVSIPSTTSKPTTPTEERIKISNPTLRPTTSTEPPNISVAAIKSDDSVAKNKSNDEFYKPGNSHGDKDVAEDEIAPVVTILGNDSLPSRLNDDNQKLTNDEGALAIDASKVDADRQRLHDDKQQRKEDKHQEHDDKHQLDHDKHEFDDEQHHHEHHHPRQHHDDHHHHHRHNDSDDSGPPTAAPVSNTTESSNPGVTPTTSPDPGVTPTTSPDPGVTPTTSPDSGVNPTTPQLPDDDGGEGEESTAKPCGPSQADLPSLVNLMKSIPLPPCIPFLSELASYGEKDIPLLSQLSSIDDELSTPERASSAQEECAIPESEEQPCFTSSLPTADFPFSDYFRR